MSLNSFLQAITPPSFGFIKQRISLPEKGDNRISGMQLRYHATAANRDQVLRFRVAMSQLQRHNVRLSSSSD
jgi:hypothetical protein